MGIKKLSSISGLQKSWSQACILKKKIQVSDDLGLSHFYYIEGDDS